MKTRAAIELDKLGVEYELKEFEPQEIGTQEVVDILGVPHEQVVKNFYIEVLELEKKVKTESGHGF